VTIKIEFSRNRPRDVGVAVGPSESENGCSRLRVSGAPARLFFFAALIGDIITYFSAAARCILLVSLRLFKFDSIGAHFTVIARHLHPNGVRSTFFE
jgi:hypothetical protein